MEQRLVVLPKHFHDPLEALIVIVFPGFYGCVL
jgi:hypothetical protein